MLTPLLPCSSKVLLYDYEKQPDQEAADTPSSKANETPFARFLPILCVCVRAIFRHVTARERRGRALSQHQKPFAWSTVGALGPVVLIGKRAAVQDEHTSFGKYFTRAHKT